MTWSESPDKPDCTIAGAAGSQVLACGPKTLAAGAEISVHVTATTSAANCGVYDNTATFTTTNDGTGNATASEACLRLQLALTKTADHQLPVNAGDAIGFTVTLHNNGPGTATGAAISDACLVARSGTVTWSESPDNPDCTIPVLRAARCWPAARRPRGGRGDPVHVTATTSLANCGVYDNTPLSPPPTTARVTPPRRRRVSAPTCS